MFAVNLRVSKSFGFGAHVESSEVSSQGMQGGHGQGYGGHHDHSFTGDRQYMLTFSVATRNLFNGVKLDNSWQSEFSPVRTLEFDSRPRQCVRQPDIDFQVRLSF